MKEKTANAWQESVNSAVDYINRHLTEPISLPQVAAVAHVSEFHFHRIFYACTGESLGSYYTRLRLERAAQLLQNSQMKLADIADKTGYQTAYALSKAFKRHFGLAPSAFRNMHTWFAAQIPKRDMPAFCPKPIIVEAPPRELMYIRIIAKYGEKAPYERAWKQLWQHAKEQLLLTGKTEYLGLSFDDPHITQDNKCRFYACITVPETTKAKGPFGRYSLPKSKYAVFTHKGSYDGLDSLYQAIYRVWLPESGKQLGNSMPFEKYLNNPDKVAPPDLLTEIHIPIK